MLLTSSMEALPSTTTECTNHISPKPKVRRRAVRLLSVISLHSAPKPKPKFGQSPVISRRISVYLTRVLHSHTRWMFDVSCDSRHSESHRRSQEFVLGVTPEAWRTNVSSPSGVRGGKFLYRYSVLCQSWILGGYSPLPMPPLVTPMRSRRSVDVRYDDIRSNAILQ